MKQQHTKKEKKEVEALTDKEIQGIEQRIKKHLHGVEGDWTVDIMLDVLTPYFYNEEDERKQKIPAPPPPPSSVSIVNPPIPSPSSIPIPITISPPRPHQDTFFHPSNNDTLFWSIYISKYGMVEYNHIGRNYGTKELEFKQKIAEDIQHFPHKYRNTVIQSYKITKPLLQEVVSDLLTSCRDTSIECMLVMMIYFQMEIIFVSREHKVYLEFLFQEREQHQEPPQIFTIHSPTTTPSKNTNNSKNNRKYNYGICMEDGSERTAYLQRIKQELHYIRLETYYKVLKPASYYKMEELENLIEKYLYHYPAIETTTTTHKKWKKAEIYDMLVEGLTKVFII